jgi:two-component system sensor histidine kinase CpxA
MHSLFWKIFFWFWTAMLILTAAVAWTTYQMRDIEGENVMGQAYNQFRENSNGAAIALERQGLAGLKQWLSESSHRKSMLLYVFGFDGRQRFGPEIPDRLRNFIMPGRGPIEGPQPHWLIIRVIQPPDDMPYQMITTFKRPNPLRLLFTPSRILIALLVSGLVCFWLARHITRPITRLRLATQKLSQGNLDVRVGRELGRRQDELASLGADFDRMAEQLQTLLMSQQQLIRDVSHELRSPLARLQVALELARKRSHGQADNELNRIELEAERLNELIGQVLALARMETRSRELNRRDTDLKQLLEMIVDDAQFEAQANRRHVALDPSSSCHVSVDEQLLHSAIENIIRNAIHYTAADTTVEIRLQTTEGNVRISIRDHGPGVAENRLQDLFKPFVRLSEARERDSGGYGLGLAIADHAVRLHDGRIEAQNCVDGGLMITIVLPLKT